MTVESLPVLLSVQYRYTLGLAGKLGCRAIPSKPRSELELTGKSKTTAVTAPLTTRFTWPEAFSMTRKSFGPRKAMPVGWLNPPTTVVTCRFGSVSDGTAANPATDENVQKRNRAADQLSIRNSLLRLLFMRHSSGSVTGSGPRLFRGDFDLAWPDCCGIVKRLGG